MADLEVLMITHNRLEYLEKALPSVLNQNHKVKLTIWDNASDQRTRDYLKRLSGDVKVIFSNKNHSLATVTNQVFLNQFTSELIGKVDPDTIVPPDWSERLIDAHSKHHFGFIGGFHFRPEDLNGLEPIIEDYNGVKVWRKHHIGGCSFVIRREDFKGYKGFGVMGLSEYQAEMGFVNGYLWDPIMYVDHMEDPRSEHFISNYEYNQYKLKTRGIDIDTYSRGIINPNYMRENTKL